MTSRFCFGIIAKHSARRNLQIIVGVYDIEGPPVPIPNTVVKLNRAENTWWVTAREDRSLPTLTKSSHPIGWLLFCCENFVAKNVVPAHFFSLEIPSYSIGRIKCTFTSVFATKPNKKHSVCALFCPLEVP